MAVRHAPCELLDPDCTLACGGWFYSIRSDPKKKTLGPCNPATKIEQKKKFENCVRRTGSNAHNALMSTLGALTSTHKYLLRPETPWENDIGLIKKLLQIFQVSLQRPLDRPGASSSRIEANASRLGASASRLGASASRDFNFLSNPCKSRGLACTSHRTPSQIPGCRWRVGCAGARWTVREFSP